MIREEYMIFDDKFNVALNYMLNFDKGFKKDFDVMYANLNKEILKYCKDCRYFYSKEDEYECWLDLCNGQACEDRELEFQYEDLKNLKKYLLNLSALDEDNINEIPQKKEAKHTNGYFDYELGSFEYFENETGMLWSYKFEIYNLKDGWHIIMTKTEDSGVENNHALTETRRIDKVVDINEIIAFVDPKKLN